MKFNLEKPIEDIIFDNRKIIHKYGFMEFASKSFRQFVLPSKKKIDIVTWERIDDECQLYIIEIKKDTVSGQNGIVQAYEYAAELTECLFKNGFNTIYLKVVLVGFDYNDLLITKFLNFLPDIYTYEMNIDGIKFTQQSEGGTILNKHAQIDLVLNSLLQ